MGQDFADFGLRRLALRRVCHRFGWLGCGLRLLALRTQGICPYCHRGQRRLGVLRGQYGLGQDGVKSLPDHQQLRLGRIEHGCKLHIDTGPAGMRYQLGGLGLPMVNVGRQRAVRGLGILPGLGGHHFNALRQQHCGFALHLCLVLQVLDHAHPFG